VLLLDAVAELGATELERLRRRPPLDDEPDVVIGHGRVTGPAARVLQLDYFPAARRVHIIHTAPGHIEWFKRPADGESQAGKVADREALERYLAEGADVVVAVGPLLRREAASLLERDDVVELLPGLPEPPGTLPRELPATFRCLLSGRAEDADLKGLDIAAGAFKLMAPRPLGERPQLIVRGAPPADADRLARELGTLAGSRQLVQVAPYVANEQDLAADLRRASVALMPSRAEGFGLSGLEAIGAGVPTLISASSGLGEVLLSAGGPATACVVAVDDDPRADAARWAQAIVSRLDDRRAAFAHAAEVHKQLADRLSWPLAANELLAALDVEAPSIEEIDVVVETRAAAADRAAPIRVNLPRRNDAFVGRTALLDALHARFQAAGSSRAQVLVGPPGVGKTEVAKEYAHRFASAYELVCWIYAADGASLRAGFAALARARDGAVAQRSEREQATLGRQWLEQHGRWLLVLDGIDGELPADESITHLDNGRILLTSRAALTPAPDVVAVEVGPLEHEEAVDFIISRAGDGDRAAAERLARVLGGVPLALAQAGAVLDEDGDSLAKYLKGLIRRAPWSASEPAHPPLEETLQLTIERAGREPLAYDLLSLAAFLATDGIPRELLATSAFLHLQGEEVVERDLDVAELAVQGLLRYALLADDGATLRVHPLVATHMRRLHGEKAGEWAAEACRLLLTALPPDASAVDGWPTFAALFTHALAATGYAMEHSARAELSGRDATVVVQLRILVAEYLTVQGRAYDAAAVLMPTLEFLTVRTAGFAETPSRLLGETRLALARVLVELGDLEGARTQARLAGDAIDDAEMAASVAALLERLGEQADEPPA
jgi:glycosyltransferase involved in cell wall biosynthesis